LPGDFDLAQYREGRATVVFNSDTVAGTDTAWLGNVEPGDIFLVRGDEVPYRVAAVTSDTSLRLNARYAAPTETSTFYSITRDFTPNYNLPIIRNGDVDAVPLFAEGLILLDSKLGPGGGGTGGGGSSTLAGLSDVSVIGSLSGDMFTKLPSGSYGFVRPYVFTISFTDAPGDGGRVYKSYSNGTVTLRRIKAAGGTVTENPDDITINIPPPGEVNTLASAGTATSQNLTATKSGTVLRTKGLRAGTNVTLTPEGNDIVIASAGGGGTAISYTLAPIGTGTSLVAAPSGTEFRVKTLSFDTSFAVTEPVGAGVSVALNNLPITKISTVLWTSITSGQVLYRNAAGNVAGLTLPAPGISALFDDKAPRLGGPLLLSGQRVVGYPVTFSGMIERPKDKTYTICLSAPVAMELSSVTAVTQAGTVRFRVDVGAVPESGGDDEIPASALQATVATTRSTTTAAGALTVDPTEAILLTLEAPSAEIQDFAYTISGVTV
jgi:hypothetical protein